MTQSRITSDFHVARASSTATVKAIQLLSFRHSDFEFHLSFEFRHSNFSDKELP